MIQVQAHRGASAYAPENTLPAFRRAVELGADGIECDIHLTTDGQYVVCHDNEIGRTSNGTGKLSEMTAAEARACDFTAGFSGWTGEPATAPLLDELLELVGGMDIINIEIKGPFRPGQDMREAYRLIAEALERHHCTERAMLSSFGHDWLKEYRELYPSMRTGLLYSEKYTPEETVAMVRKYNAWAIHPWLGGIDEVVLGACRKADIACNVWTVDSPEDIRRAIELEPTGIITDVPDLVMAALRLER